MFVEDSDVTFVVGLGAAVPILFVVSMVVGVDIESVVVGSGHVDESAVRTSCMCNSSLLRCASYMAIAVFRLARTTQSL